LDVPFDRSVEEYAQALLSSPSFTTLTPPRADKWRELNRAEIERVLPLVAPVERRLGY